MGLFDRVEGKLERAYNGLFARAFRAEVQPVEIASAIRRAMDDRASHGGRGRSLVPNIFTIELSETDHDRLTHLGDDVADELVVAAEEHVASQHYTPGGPIRINLTYGRDLETGVFRVRPMTAKRADAPRRPAPPPVDEWDDEPEAADYAADDDPYAADDGYAADVPSARPGRGGADHGAASAGAAAAGAVGGAAIGGAGIAGAAAGAATAAGPSGAAYRDPAARPAPTHRPSPTPVHAPVGGGRPKGRASDRPWLVLDGHRYLLISAINILGRDDDVDIVLDDPGVSRRHSEIRVSIDGPHFVAVIRDLGSTNGTFVNGERVDSAHLYDGDQVTVGRSSLTYRANRP